MAQYYTDFSEYDLDSVPPDWIRYESGGSSTYLHSVRVASHSSSPTGRSLSYSKSGSSPCSLIWDIVDSDLDREVEVLVLMAGGLGATNHGIIVRSGNGLSSGLQAMWYQTSHNASSASVRIRQNNTSILASTTTPVLGYSYDFVWMRFRTEGNALKLKYWWYGDPEPTAWLLEADGHYDNGPGTMVGILILEPRGRPIVVYSVATGGDVAESPLLLTGHDATLSGVSSIVPLTASGSLYALTPSISGTLEVQGRAATSGTMYVASTDSGLIVKTASVAPDGSFVVDNLDRHTTYRVWGTTDVNGKTYTTQVRVMEAD